MLQYEDELLQALAQSVMPMDRLIGSADKAATLSLSLQEQPARQREDLLAQELMSWFKHEFFTWVCKAAVLSKLHPDGQSCSCTHAVCLVEYAAAAEHCMQASPSPVKAYAADEHCKQVPPSPVNRSKVDNNY